MATKNRTGRLFRTEQVVLAGSFLLLLLAFAATSAATRRTLINSAILAAGATAIALPLGTLLAVLLSRYDLPGRRAAIACLGVLLFLPLYVQLSGWDACLGKLGWFSSTYGSMAEPILAGMRGAILVHGFPAVPWAALLVGAGLLQMDSTQEEAALLVVPPREVLWRITLPQARPFIAAAAIWAALSTTSEMTVTNIFLINPSDRTFTEQFYMAFALSADAGEATLAVLPGMVGLALIIGLTLWMLAQYGKRRIHQPSARVVDLSAGRFRPVLGLTPRGSYRQPDFQSGLRRASRKRRARPVLVGSEVRGRDRRRSVALR
jgi:iron(III) transport system permease protein